MLSSPSVTGDTQPIIRIVDDLPAPFGPRKPNDSPRWTSTSMPSTATKSPKRFTSERAEINGRSVPVAAVCTATSGNAESRPSSSVLVRGVTRTTVRVQADVKSRGYRRHGTPDWSGE